MTMPRPAAAVGQGGRRALLLDGVTDRAPRGRTRFRFVREHVLDRPGQTPGAAGQSIARWSHESKTCHSPSPPLPAFAGTCFAGVTGNDSLKKTIGSCGSTTDPM